MIFINTLKPDSFQNARFRSKKYPCLNIAEFAVVYKICFLEKSVRPILDQVLKFTSIL